MAKEKGMQYGITTQGKEFILTNSPPNKGKPSLANHNPFALLANDSILEIEVKEFIPPSP